MADNEWPTLPDVHFGKAGKTSANAEQRDDDDDIDSAELSKILGFDPFAESDETDQ